MASRYAAVFPLSELINWVFHTRGQRAEEIPHSYQMMLFWAGLRGAVGVALAAGITGDNADALRTTILVVVVLTVIVFGGTTSRMLEVLGIRVGVEDEDASSEDEEPWTTQQGHLALQSGPISRRYPYSSQNGRGWENPSEFDLQSPEGSPYNQTLKLSQTRQARSGSYGQGVYGYGVRSGFSTNSDESDEEVLPSAGPSGAYGDGYDPEAGAPGSSSDSRAGEGRGTGMIFRDGQWFTALDERYLLPLFSNSVTARRHHAKKAVRKGAMAASGAGGGGTAGSGSKSGSTAGTPRRGSLELGDDEYGGDGESENGKNKGLPRTFR